MKRKEQNQSRWHAGEVHRSDASNLYNAVDVTGREYDQTPTHSLALAQELAARLNRAPNVHTHIEQAEDTVDMPSCAYCRNLICLQDGGAVERSGDLFCSSLCADEAEAV